MNNRTSEITIQEREYHQLHYSFYTDNQIHPLLFFFHGFTGNRNSGIMGRGEVLASLGFHVVAFDAPLHGDRATPEFLNLDSANKQKAMMDIIITNADDAKKLYLEHLIHNPLIKKGPIYAFGVSMGAAVAFYLATICDELKTIVTLVGSPSFVEFYAWKKEKYHWESDALFQQRICEYEKYDPLLNHERLATKNIFMGVGLKDETVPLIYAKELKEKLTSNAVVYREYDTAHASTPEMLEDAYTFLAKNS